MGNKQTKHINRSKATIRGLLGGLFEGFRLRFKLLGFVTGKKGCKDRDMQRMQIRHQDRGNEGQRCVGGLRSYTKTRIGKKKSSSSIGVMTSLTGKGGITISDGGKKMYKRSVQKAKETTRLKRRKTVMRNKIEQKKLMRESLKATKRDAAEGKSRYRLLKMMRNELRDEVNRVINDFVRLRALETLVMQDLGFF